MKILVTGGAGFLGHHFVEHILRNTDCDVDILDALTYASLGFDRLKEIGAYNNERVRTFTADIALPIDGCLEQELQGCDYIVHLAAETHVDRSIAHPEDFVRSNVLGTMNVLQFARKCPDLQRMVYFSTDEVFGPAPEGRKYAEWDRYDSRNPYAATKAAGEELALAWANTYRLPVMITHTMNIIGERQHPEKFIPATLRKILHGETVTIHADPSRTKAGSRSYIHTRNVADALLFLLNRGEPREKYNIVGEREIDNLTLAREIADIAGKPLAFELVDFHSSRPGHDMRYALDGTKLAAMGYTFPKSFDESLEKTIRWTMERPEWLEERA